MNSTKGPSASRAKRWRRLLWWLAIPCAVVALMAALWYRTDVRARARLDAARAAFAAHGMPASIPEIVPPAAPPSDNADPLLREALAIVSGSTNFEHPRGRGVFAEIEALERNTPPTPGQPPRFSPETFARLESLVAGPEVARFEEKMREATARPVWDQGLDYSQGPALLVPHVGVARDFVRILTLSALAHARSDATASRARENLAMAQIVADWSDDSPTLISFLTGIAARGSIRAAVIEIIAGDPGFAMPEAFIAREAKSVRETASRFERALHGERICYLDWLTHRYADGDVDWVYEMREFTDRPAWLEKTDPWFSSLTSRLGRPRLRAEFARCYELLFTAIEAVRASNAESTGRWAAFSAGLDAEQGPLVSVLVPALEPLAARVRISQAEQQAFLIVLAAFAHHQRAGTWPGSLDELHLDAELLQDPCSDLPLVLRVTADDVVAYAPGIDGDDDGGRAVDRTSSDPDDGDVVVRVPLPKPRAPE